jgi:uncharacterized protein YggE
MDWPMRRGMAHSSSERPDVITVQAAYEETVRATHVDLHVTVRGSSLVSGRAALRRAAEINTVMELIVPEFIAEEDVHVENVQAKVSGGLLGRSSSAVYELRIVCRELDHLPDVLGAVTGQKHAKLERLEWQYGDDAEIASAADRRLETALERARARGEGIARALGVRLTGVHGFREVQDHGWVGDLLEEPEPRMCKSRRVLADVVDVGVQIANETKQRCCVEVQFHVSKMHVAADRELAASPAH